MAENGIVEDRALGWDEDVDEGDGGNFITLPAGEYAFRVLSFERGEYHGGDKIGPCKKAIIKIELDGGDLGKATINENLLLHTKTRGIIHSFFKAIGEKKNPETGMIRMNWAAAPGATGRAKVKVRSYTKDGEERTVNQISHWIEPADTDVQQPAAFTPGSF